MDTTLAPQLFEQHRTRLTSIAQRMLGSASDADDAVQETWLRVARTNAADIDNVAAWLTTIAARICLNMLRSRTNRHEDPFETVTPDPASGTGDGPEAAAALADSVSLALLVVLETLDPAERLAFVLHDMFAVPFDEIAKIVERTPAATRQLASRARRRIQTPHPGGGAVHAGEHRRVVDAFFAAARGGDLEALMTVLDPNLVLRSVGAAIRPAATLTVRGAREVAGRALHFARPDAELLPVRVNGGKVGVLASVGGVRISLMVFTVENDLITEIDTLVDPSRLAGLDLEAP